MAAPKIEREFDIFTKESGSWRFTERVKATTLDEAKHGFLRANQRISVWDVVAYPRK
jgi:hypothetical protein